MTEKIDDLIARAELMLAENQWTSGWGVEALAEELCDALVSVRAERDAALARIAELEKSRDRWEELCGKIASEKYDLNARIAEAAKLHRKAHAVFSWATGGVRYEDPCPDCDGKAGVHDCGCWADVDIEYHCAECDGSGERVSWPCPTAVALGLNEGESDGVS